MTDPLIDPFTMFSIIVSARKDLDWERHCQNIRDAVLTYLREVLTPEALDSYGTGDPDLYRLIFGEDR
jgi:hypothetical protein